MVLRMKISPEILCEDSWHEGITALCWTFIVIYIILVPLMGIYFAVQQSYLIFHSARSRRNNTDDEQALTLYQLTEDKTPEQWDLMSKQLKEKNQSPQLDEYNEKHMHKVYLAKRNWGMFYLGLKVSQHYPSSLMNYERDLPIESEALFVGRESV